jgi:hypothetical protein
MRRSLSSSSLCFRKVRAQIPQHHPVASAPVEATPELKVLTPTPTEASTLNACTELVPSGLSNNHQVQALSGEEEELLWKRYGGEEPEEDSEEDEGLEESQGDEAPTDRYDDEFFEG